MTSVLATLAAILLLLPATVQARSGAATAARTGLAAATASTSWTEYHLDDGHTGYDPTQPQLTAVSTGWVSATMDQNVYAEPLVFNGVVYAATLNNTVYAINQTTGATVWSNHLGAPESGGWNCGNVSPQGILGTPVIDTVAGLIYVAAFFHDATEGVDVYRVIGLNLASGAKQFDTAINIPGFDWHTQQERGSLALHSGFVYVAMGGRYGDCPIYYGYVVGVPTSGSGSQPFYRTAGTGSGIWAGGGPVVDDATGNVFAATGNGDCGAALQNDAVVRLNPTTLAMQDYFMPADWQANWCNPDQDLGGAGPLLISPNLLFQAGKHGGGFLLNPNNLGHIGGQLYPAQSPYVQADVCHGNTGDATFGSFAYAAPFVYLECDSHGLVALNVNTSTPSFTICGSTCGAPDWSAGGSATFGPPIVAGGAVWVVDIGGSGLYAFNQTTGAQMFHSAGFGVNHFVTPAEASGQVFVPSQTVIRSFVMTTGVTFTPPRLDFNGQAPTTTSAAQTVTLHNNESTTLNVTTAAVTGANASDYVKGTDTCTGAALASGGTCTVQVSFRPPSLGGFPASLTFTDSASDSPQNVALDGMGSLDNQTHLYTLDRFGGLHADGTATPMASSAYWSGWNIARGAALFPDGSGGYTLDGYGGLHNFGSAPSNSASAYWSGWDIARGVTLAPWSTSSAAVGWTLDGYGGIHPFGGAPAIAGFSYWGGSDIARGLVILPDSTPSSVAGYTLDGFGGVHPFGGATAVANFSYWPGWDIAHSITLSPNASKTNPAGWTLDGFGGVHAFGNAPAQTTSGYWPGWDIARGIVAWTGSGTGGWVIDAWGGLHPFGGAPTVSPFSYWPSSNLAASLAGPGFSSGARAT